MAFVNYLKSVTGKEFDYNLEWQKISPQKATTGGKCTFETPDLEASIPFNFFVMVPAQEVNKDELEVYVETYVFHKNKKHKLTKSTHVTKKVTALSNPQKLFPKTKLNKIFGGQKKGKFTKKDMLTFLETKLKAEIRGPANDIQARIPIGDGHYLIMYRMVVMKEPSWGINGVFGEKGKRISSLPTALMMENEDTAEFIESIVELASKARDVEDKIKRLEYYIKDYKQRKGM
ncbi:MAG: hypothetical protein ACOC5T_07560 [Elusimicrobiota bacterium]